METSMTTATSTRPSRRRTPPRIATEEEAASLWEELRLGFIQQEQLILKILQRRAWAALGYETFVEAWQDRMQGIRLATDFAKAQVVYQFYATMPVPEIAEILNVRPEQVEYLGAQLLAGVPADAASARPPRRRDNSGARVTVRLETQVYQAYDRIAREHNSDLHTECEKALRAHFNRLGRR